MNAIDFFRGACRMTLTGGLRRAGGARVNLTGADLTVDEAREAFHLATADGQWRRWWQYVDAILDAALEAHETHASA